MTTERKHAAQPLIKSIKRTICMNDMGLHVRDDVLDNIDTLLTNLNDMKKDWPSSNCSTDNIRQFFTEYQPILRRGEVGYYAPSLGYINKVVIEINEYFAGKRTIGSLKMVLDKFDGFQISYSLIEKYEFLTTLSHRSRICRHNTKILLKYINLAESEDDDLSDDVITYLMGIYEGLKQYPPEFEFFFLWHSFHGLPDPDSKPDPASKPVKDSVLNAVRMTILEGLPASKKEMLKKDIYGKSDIDKIIVFYDTASFIESKSAAKNTIEKTYEVVKEIKCEELKVNLAYFILLDYFEQLKGKNDLLARSAEAYLTTLINDEKKQLTEKFEIFDQLVVIFSGLESFDNLNDMKQDDDTKQLGQKVYTDIYQALSQSLAQNQLENYLNLLSDISILYGYFMPHIQANKEKQQQESGGGGDDDILWWYPSAEEEQTAYDNALKNKILPDKRNPNRERAAKNSQVAALAIGLFASTAIFVASGGSAYLGLQIAIAVTTLVIAGIGESIKRSSRDAGPAKNLLAWLSKVDPKISKQPILGGASREKKH